MTSATHKVAICAGLVAGIVWTGVFELVQLVQHPLSQQRLQPRDIYKRSFHRGKPQLAEKAQDNHAGGDAVEASEPSGEHERKELDPAMDFIEAVDRQGFRAERSCGHGEKFEVWHARVEMSTLGITRNVLKS